MKEQNEKASTKRRRRNRRVTGSHLAANAARVRYRVVQIAQDVSGFRVHLREAGAARLNGAYARKKHYAVQILTGDPVLAGRFKIGGVITLRVRQAPV